MRGRGRFRHAAGKNARRAFGASPFSAFLIGLGLVFWTMNVFAVVTLDTCSNALFWLSGWRGFVAPMQVLFAGIALSAVFFLIRLFSPGMRDGVAETLMQGLLIAAIIVSAGGLKATVLPFGVPSYQAYFAVVEKVFPVRIKLDEERDEIPWRNDYPPPPFDPRDRELMPYEKLFPHKDSPWPSELAAARQCIADQEAGLAAYEEWLEGFKKWEEQNW